MRFVVRDATRNANFAAAGRGPNDDRTGSEVSDRTLDVTRGAGEVDRRCVGQDQDLRASALGATKHLEAEGEEGST